MFHKFIPIYEAIRYEDNGLFCVESQNVWSNKSLKCVHSSEIIICI